MATKRVICESQGVERTACHRATVEALAALASTKRVVKYMQAMPRGPWRLRQPRNEWGELPCKRYASGACADCLHPEVAKQACGAGQPLQAIGAKVDKHAGWRSRNSPGVFVFFCSGP